jgi:hypothetical protein
MKINHLVFVSSCLLSLSLGCTLQAMNDTCDGDERATPVRGGAAAAASIGNEQNDNGRAQASQQQANAASATVEPLDYFDILFSDPAFKGFFASHHGVDQRVKSSEYFMSQAANVMEKSDIEKKQIALSVLRDALYQEAYSLCGPMQRALEKSLESTDAEVRQNKSLPLKSFVESRQTLLTRMFQYSSEDHPCFNIKNVPLAAALSHLNHERRKLFDKAIDLRVSNADLNKAIWGDAAQAAGAPAAAAAVADDQKTK